MTCDTVPAVLTAVADEVLDEPADLLERLARCAARGETMPRSTLYLSSISEQARALKRSLAGKHTFIDGHERGAFAATAVFRTVWLERCLVPASK